MIHKEAHPLAGKTVKIASGTYKGEDYRVEDWHDRLMGKSWMFCDGNPACLDYAIRTGMKDRVPTDNEVLYGKIGAFGKLIHASELSKDHATRVDKP